MTTVQLTYLASGGGWTLGIGTERGQKPILWVAPDAKKFVFDHHPFDCQTTPVLDSNGNERYLTTPYSEWVANNCYHEQVSGNLVLTPSGTNTSWLGIIPIAIGTYSVEFTSISYPGKGWRGVYEAEITAVHRTLYGYRLDGTYRVYYLDHVGWGSNGPLNQDYYFFDFAKEQFFDWYPNSPQPSDLLGVETFRTSQAAIDSLIDRYDNPTQAGPMYWGSLCERAAASVRSLDLNGLAFLKDSIDLTKAIYHFIDKGPIISGGEVVSRLGTRISSLRHAARQSASTYLGYHYGTRLMVKDLTEVDLALAELKSQAKNLFQRASASEEAILSTAPIAYLSGPLTWTRRVNATLRSFSDPLLHTVEGTKAALDQLKDRVMRAGYELDLLPSLSNIWDLIPFSFVVDWFLPIGDRLATLETKGYMSTLPLILVCYTQIFEFDTAYTHPLPDWECSGRLHHRIYVRKCDDQFVLPTLVGRGQGSFKAHQHIVEASALLTNFFA